MELIDVAEWINKNTGAWARHDVKEDGYNHIYIDGALSIAEIKALARAVEDME